MRLSMQAGPAPAAAAATPEGGAPRNWFQQRG
jgi:hypothetical protein